MISIAITENGIEIHEEKNIRNKGKSLLELPDDYSVIDIETTDLSSKWGDILEISALKVRNDVIVDKLSYLIKPDNFTQVDPFTENLTGITTEMILKDGYDTTTVLKHFLEFIGEDIIVGHNVNFDINFLYDVIDQKLSQRFHNNFVDTYRLSKYYAFRDIPEQTLIKLSEELKLESNQFHRSLADSYTTFNLYQKIKEKLGQEWTVTKKRSYTTKLKATDIVGDPTKRDIYNPFYQSNVVFTGHLNQFIRRDAQKLIADIGGTPQDNVNKSTNYLVIGTQDKKKIKGDFSNKQKKAMQLKATGQDINIIDEDIFLDMLADHISEA